MENKNTKKKVQLVFEPRVSRKLLKKNGEWKYCPFCATPLADGCECHKNLVVDTKPLRDGNGESIFCFDNNEMFQKDFAEEMDEIKARKESQYEQMSFDDVT